MPVLAIGQPVETGLAALLVENRLEPGGHRFQLVVVDSAGNASEPAEVLVTVRRALVITPVAAPITTLPISRLSPVPQPPFIRTPR